MPWVQCRGTCTYFAPGKLAGNLGIKLDDAQLLAAEILVLVIESRLRFRAVSYSLYVRVAFGGDPREYREIRN